MAKLVHSVSRSDAPEAVRARIRGAEKILSVALSEAEIAYPVGFHTEYIPYAEIERCGIATEESRAMKGCMTGTALVTRLLIRSRGKDIFIPFDRPVFAERALEIIRRHAPEATPAEV